MISNRVTIADVAREAGVSAQTVSRALNNKGEISAETRERVLATVERLGYRPNTLARGLVTQKTSTLGLVVPDIANPFFSEVTRGAEDAAHQAGYSLFLCNAMEDPAREVEALRTLEAQRVDGIILCSSRLSEQEFGAMMARLPAVVLVNRAASGNDLRSVCIDDEAGARCATQHLLHTEHRSIAFLAGPQASYSGLRRARGYQDALSEAGVPIDPELSVTCTPHLEGGYNAARQLLSRRPGTDAILCYNDLVAVGALQACAAMGRRVPEDVAVVGCDDILLAGLVTPPLTTLRSDKRALGAEAVRLLLRKMAGCADGCENVMLQPELVVRASAPALEITAENAESAERKPGTSAPSAPSAVKLTSSTQGIVKAGHER
jgi:LacI family transcriptional regulator